MNYWVNREERAKQAEDHTNDVGVKYKDNIMLSIRNSVIHQDVTADSWIKYGYKYRDTKTTFVAKDTVSAIMGIDKLPGEKICVLNFASFKNPGGMFLKGSSAQEESLCHESNLYNILLGLKNSYYIPNRKNVNNCLYSNRMIWTPDVVFKRGSSSVLCDVITCAAPNANAARKYYGVSNDDIVQALTDRIRAVLYCAMRHDTDILVLGAFGCGVFGNDPVEVATIFKKNSTILDGKFKEVIYAVPNGGPEDKNFAVFEEMFS